MAGRDVPGKGMAVSHWTDAPRLGPGPCDCLPSVFREARAAGGPQGLPCAVRAPRCRLHRDSPPHPNPCGGGVHRSDTHQRSTWMLWNIEQTCGSGPAWFLKRGCCSVWLEPPQVRPAPRLLSTDAAACWGPRSSALSHAPQCSDKDA